MRKIVFVAFCLAMGVSVAMAQSKVDTKWHCGNPAVNHQLDVGDEPAHAYAITQGSCTATTSASGEKTGAYTAFQESWKASSTNHGRFNVTMDNGDMAYYTYEGSAPIDITKPASNKWKIHGGTGKQKGITGSGACTGARHEDGSSDWTCTGTYSMGK